MGVQIKSQDATDFFKIKICENKPRIRSGTRGLFLLIEFGGGERI